MLLTRIYTDRNKIDPHFQLSALERQLLGCAVPSRLTPYHLRTCAELKSSCLCFLQVNLIRPH